MSSLEDGELVGAASSSSSTTFEQALTFSSSPSVSCAAPSGRVYVEPEYVAPTRAKLPVHGNAATMNLPEPLVQYIKRDAYFRGLYALKAFHPVLHEMQRELTSLSVYEAGSTVKPSRSMILLFKLYTLRLTENQISNLIRCPDSALIRALGFLYLRLTVPPAAMVDWLWDYLADSHALQLTPKSPPTTVGQFCRRLLTHKKFDAALPLPRIPPDLAREIAVQMADQFPSMATMRKKRDREDGDHPADVQRQRR